MGSNHKASKRVADALRAGHIRFVVYGDDHVIGTHKSINKWINEAGFAKFVSKYFGMTIRDARRITEFCSTMNPDGTLRTRGVVFLQRFFVKNRGDPLLPEILPVRPIEKIIVGYAYGRSASRQNLIDYVLAITGQAYDCGYNHVAYLFCKYVYDELMKLDIKFDFASLIEEKIRAQGDNDIKKLIHRLGLTKEELMRGFPSWADCMAMHVRDDDKNDFSRVKIDDLLAPRIIN